MVFSRSVLSLLGCLTLILIPVSGSAQDTFYYHNGKKVPLKLVVGKKYVVLEAGATQNSIASNLNKANSHATQMQVQKIPAGVKVSESYRPSARKWAVVSVAPAVESAVNTPQAINLAPIKEQVVYEAPFVRTPAGREVGVSQFVYVKLKKATDVEILKKRAVTLKFTIVGNNEFLPLWYTVEVSSQSAGNALEIANQLYETQDFSAVEPDFLNEYAPQSNDTFYPMQWGLKNTGQHGTGSAGNDIRIEAAWQTTIGAASVVVAVLDHGIDLSHEDLARIHATSYDTVTGGNSQVRGSHGTACAGIVGAESNNGKGVAGVSPGITLMSVSDPLVISPLASQQLANGIGKAWQSGADVISNSWGHNDLASGILEDAIETAMESGRGGKGVVMVFAAGNENGPVGYPARVHADIVVVGAMSPCGERKSPSSCDSENWGSNFGSQLDLVAPGVKISTTDRTGTSGYDLGDYTAGFNGTSSACPHVAGVAALILSINPDLTQREVGDILESTARKVGGYNYESVSGRSNGKFHQEMGYGLLNASAAVEAASQSLTGAKQSTIRRSGKQSTNKRSGK